jgi:hypothetical protein
MIGSSSEWSLSPGTVEAVGTATATLIAATAVLIAVIQNRSEAKRRLRDQAMQVSFYETNLDYYNHDDPHITMEMHVANHSHLPIYGVSMILRHTGPLREALLKPLTPRELATTTDFKFPLKRGRQTHVEFCPRSESVLAPSKNATITLSLDRERMPVSPRFSVALTFQDAAGQSWALSLEQKLRLGHKEKLLTDPLGR